MDSLHHELSETRIFLKNGDREMLILVKNVRDEEVQDRESLQQ